jgi:hypothetical protein
LQAEDRERRELVKDARRQYVIAFVLVCCKFSRAPSRKRDVQAPMLLKTPSLSPLILVREVQ